MQRFENVVADLERLQNYWSRPLQRRILLSVIVVIGVVIRALTIGWYGLQKDEAQSLNIAGDPSIFHIFSVLKGDGNVPMMPLFYRPLVMLFGNRDVPEKFVALLISAAVPLIAYRLFVKKVGLFFALELALLMALAPTMIRFGDLVRWCGPVYIFFLLSTDQLFALLRKPASDYKKYGLLVAAMMYTHIFSAIVLGGHALLVLIRLVQGSLDRPALMAWIRGLLVAGLLFLPWTFNIYWQLHHNLAPWYSHQLWWQNLFSTAIGMFRQSTGPGDIAANVLGWTAMFVCWSKVTSSEASKEFASEIDQGGWTIVLAGTMLSALYLFEIGMPWTIRYVSVFSPLAMVALVLGVRKIAQAGSLKTAPVRLSLLLVSLVPVILLVISWIPNWVFLFRFPESAVAQLLREFKPRIDPSKDLIVVSWEMYGAEVTRKLDLPCRVVVFPDIEFPCHPFIVTWNGLDARIHDEARVPLIYEAMDKTLKNHGSIWVFGKFFPASWTEAQLRKVGNYVSFEDIRVLQIHRWLESHARQDGDDIIRYARESDLIGSHFVPRD